MKNVSKVVIKYVTQTFFKTLVWTVCAKIGMTLKKLFTPLKHQDLDSPITVEFVVTVASAAVKTEEGNKPN